MQLKASDHNLVSVEAESFTRSVKTNTGSQRSPEVCKTVTNKLQDPGESYKEHYTDKKSYKEEHTDKESYKEQHIDKKEL